MLHLVGGEEKTYHRSRMLAHLLRPTKKALSIPLQIGLVIRRHVLLCGAVLAGTAMEAQMGGDAGTSEEYLHRGPGEAHIYLLLDYS